MLIADICGQWLGLWLYADIDIGLAPLLDVLPRQTSCQDVSAKICLGPSALAIFGENSWKITKAFWLFYVKFHG